MNEWIFHLQADDLFAAFPPKLAAEIHLWEASGMSLDQIGEQIGVRIVSGSVKGRRRDSDWLWPALRNEMWLLICTDDPKYQGVRVDLVKESKVAGTVALSLISSAVSIHVGIEAGMVAPFAALLLLALLRTSKEAWCANHCLLLSDPSSN